MKFIGNAGNWLFYDAQGFTWRKFWSYEGISCSECNAVVYHGFSRCGSPDLKLCYMCCQTEEPNNE